MRLTCGRLRGIYSLNAAARDPTEGTHGDIDSTVLDSDRNSDHSDRHFVGQNTNQAKIALYSRPNAGRQSLIY